jgi:hypothetical protein
MGFKVTTEVYRLGSISEFSRRLEGEEAVIRIGRVGDCVKMTVTAEGVRRLESTHNGFSFREMIRGLLPRAPITVDIAPSFLRRFNADTLVCVIVDIDPDEKGVEKQYWVSYDPKARRNSSFQAGSQLVG